jgi:hypothetical protein
MFARVPVYRQRSLLSSRFTISSKDAHKIMSLFNLFPFFGQHVHEPESFLHSSVISFPCSLLGRPCKYIDLPCLAVNMKKFAPFPYEYTLIVLTASIGMFQM